MKEIDDLREECKRLAGEYAHVYAFVGDDTMPRKHAELHAAIDRLAALAEQSNAHVGEASKVVSNVPAMFDAFGEPRVRYVRVTLDGSHCVMRPQEGDTYIADAKASDDQSNYVLTDVYLSEREFDDLPDFDGF